MGFEVEFVYVAPGATSQDSVFDKCEQELVQLGLHVAPDQFHVEADNSIVTHKQPGHFGIELVSPPLPLAANLDNLHKVFSWMQAQGHETNSSTGLHINLSVPELSVSNLDKLKLLLLLDERQVQQLFDRLMNSYTQSHVEILKQAVATAHMTQKPWTQIRDFPRIKQALNAQIDLDKYRTVNFSKLQQGYLEFRIMGNQDYHKRFETVREVVLRYAYVLLSALDAHAFVPEYHQALARVLAQGINQAAPVYPDLSHKYASVGAGARPKDHMQVLNYIQRARKAVQDSNPKAAVKLITMALQKAHNHARTNVKPELITAAALSYRILIQKILGMSVQEFEQAQTQAGVNPEWIQKLKTYLKH